ncbi:MAG: DUF1178 family protein [Deltaproteobacteria bacterium]|nr:DUF1178 family protein [Deltaproteobacteria bacterium]
MFQTKIHDIEEPWQAYRKRGIGGVIIYDLKCERSHIFEGWFNDRTAFEAQKEKKLVACPVCGSSNIEIVPSSITVMGKDAGRLNENNKKLSPVKALRMFNEYMDKTFEDVGGKFAEVALKIHIGEEDSRNIKGTVTKSEEDTLREEGVPFVKIPIPKFDS